MTPTNFSLDELLKYKYPELEGFVSSALEEHEKDYLEVVKESELAYEQLHLCEKLLREIKEIIVIPGNKREMVKAINLAYRGSQVEL